MKNWILGGIAALSLPIVTQADSQQGTVQGHRNATGAVCSDGGSCCAPCTQPCRDNCCPSCCGTWELEGTALYWRVCRDDEAFAVARTTGTNTERNEIFAVHPDNEWGFRIKGQYTTCDRCKFASLQYTYFDETDRARTGAAEFSVFGGVDGIDARIDNEYQRLDGRLGHYVCQGCRGGFYGYGGISWIYIRDRERLDAFTSSEQFFYNQRNRYSAAGFEAGVGGHYRVCGGFGFAGEFGGIAAIGDRDVNFDILGPSLYSENSPTGVTICIPGLDLKLEAFYECCWCGYNWGIFVGYEHHHFWNAKKLEPLFLDEFDTIDLIAEALYKDFGVGGLYFGARVGY